METMEVSPREQPRLGVIIVDHGSRRGDSNRMLEEFVERYAAMTNHLVEPAHMELAEPSLATAFDRCAARGAERVIVAPYFLLPGKHWDLDIPALTAAAARKHPGVEYLVAAPIGLHPMMLEVMQARIEHCLAHAGGTAAECESCAGSRRCEFRQG
jgi:sirohydrochlorin ferrochelatase